MLYWLALSVFLPHWQRSSMFIQALFRAFSPNYRPSRTLFSLLDAWLPTLLWAGLIYLFSANSVLPSFTQSLPDFIFKKSAHMFVYAVLYLLSYRAIRLTVSPKRHRIHWMLAVVVCMMYAVSDEFHQLLVPGRYGTLRDIGFDMLGVSTALLLQHRYL